MQTFYDIKKKHSYYPDPYPNSSYYFRSGKSITVGSGLIRITDVFLSPFFIYPILPPLSHSIPSIFPLSLPSPQSIPLPLFALSRGGESIDKFVHFTLLELE